MPSLTALLLADACVEKEWSDEARAAAIEARRANAEYASGDPNAGGRGGKSAENHQALVAHGWHKTGEDRGDGINRGPDDRVSHYESNDHPGEHIQVWGGTWNHEGGGKYMGSGNDAGSLDRHLSGKES